jgi:hypothetical protein
MLTISAFIPRLREAVKGEPPTYHRFWTLAIRGAIPGTEKIDGKWLVDPDRTADIAASLGLELKPARKGKGGRDV